MIAISPQFVFEQALKQNFMFLTGILSFCGGVFLAWEIGRRFRGALSVTTLRWGLIFLSIGFGGSGALWCFNEATNLGSHWAPFFMFVILMLGVGLICLTTGLLVLAIQLVFARFFESGK